MTVKRTPASASRQQWKERIREGGLQATVWTLSLVALFALLIGRTERYEYTGIARTMEYQVASDVEGRVQTLFVDLYEDVVAGQPLIALDTAPLEARLATARAELDELQSQLALARVNGGHADAGDAQDWSTDLRRFEMDAADRRLEALNLRVEIESDEVLRERWKLRLERAAKVREQRVISEQDYDDIRLKHQEIVRRIEENRRLLAHTEVEGNFAEERATAFNEERNESMGQYMLAPWKARAAVQEFRIAEIANERDRLILRAPVNGRVVRVLGRAGSVAAMGVPLLAVTSEFATEIVGYLPQTGSNDIQTGHPVIIEATRPGLTAIRDSEVLRISPVIEELPMRLWRRPGVAEFGRPVIVAATAELGLVPGELVRIRTTGWH